jgi:hypothetical protein
MTDKHKYTYSVLRYVHDIMTGEFINVGIVMHVPSLRMLKSQTRSTIGRLKGAFPDLDRSAFLSAMSSVRRSSKRLALELADETFEFESGDALKFARKIVGQDDSSLQWSTISGGVTDDVEKTFARVFERMVVRYDGRFARRRTDDEVWRPVREKLAERGVNVDLEGTVIVGATDDLSLKHAWKNGVWHAYEPLSFDLVDADGIKEKARRWRGHLEAVADGPHDKVKINFILGAPQNAALLPAFRTAVKILERSALDPVIYEESQIDDLVASIEDEVRAHHAA